MVAKATGDVNFLRRHWRAVLAAVTGAVVGLITELAGLPPGLCGLIGWNAASLLFLSATLLMMIRDDEATVRARAGREDQGEAATVTIVLLAVVVSLAATVFAMHEAKAGGSHPKGAALWAPLLSALTLLQGWLVIQTVFTLRYAHRYFGDGNADGQIDGGITFPGDPPRTYLDFVYLAICVGATAQVSDVSITTANYRMLVTQHAIMAFFFNTTVVALGINIIATIIGQ